ncbi:MAG: hypothetical protein JWQ70_1675 [Aeromicrobium sp.]|nr:hypothetical protein [Aeromicrobium sp.]
MAGPAAASIPPDFHCPKGEVSITFDDGPSRDYTPRLLKILRHEHAQATFFVQGKNVQRFPSIVRNAARDGHAVENHSWDHPDLTRQSSHKVDRQLSRTQRAIRAASGHTPGLFRPPYGDDDARVRKIARRQHLQPELWTIDTEDWTGISASRIRKAALKGLRPHKANVILMHDAVINTPSTLKAVPGIISGLRKKGYCLVPLESMARTPKLAVKPVTTDEGREGPVRVPVTLKLDSMALVDAVFRLRSVAGTAKEGFDFRRVDQEVTVPRGERSVTVFLRVFPDPMPNTAKEFTLTMSGARGVSIARPRVQVTITDNQTWDARPSTPIKPMALSALRLTP